LSLAWGSVVPVAGVLGLPSSTSDDDRVRWRSLAVLVDRAIGGEGHISDEILPALTGECGAVLVVDIGDVIG
jgi:hypothetical protein